MDDKEILQLYLERDERAIAHTQEKYGAYCHTIAHNVLSDDEDAKECVNDVWMTAWNCIPPHQPAVLSAFLAKLTRRISLKKWRDARAQKRGGGEPALVYEELAECIPGNTDVEEAAIAAQLAHVIDHFLDTLPPIERQVFVCRYWYFDSIAAIGERFHFSKSKVKSMLYRTRRKLAITLEKEGFSVE